MTTGQKTISLPEPLYNRLKAKKKPGENFQDVITRLLNQEEHHEKPPVSKFFGVLGDDSDEWDKIEEEIYNDRSRESERDAIRFDDE